MVHADWSLVMKDLDKLRSTATTLWGIGLIKSGHAVLELCDELQSLRQELDALSKAHIALQTSYSAQAKGVAKLTQFIQLRHQLHNAAQQQQLQQALGNGTNNLPNRKAPKTPPASRPLGNERSPPPIP